jgi:hypothetical protein
VVSFFDVTNRLKSNFYRFPFQIPDFFYVLTAQIAMGLPVKSEQLWDLLTIANNSAKITNLQEEIAINNAGIAENLASIGSINKDITNVKSCQTSK